MMSVFSIAMVATLFFAVAVVMLLTFWVIATHVRKRTVVVAQPGTTTVAPPPVAPAVVTVAAPPPAVQQTTWFRRYIGLIAVFIIILCALLVAFFLRDLQTADIAEGVGHHRGFLPRNWDEVVALFGVVLLTSVVAGGLAAGVYWVMIGTNYLITDDKQHVFSKRFAKLFWAGLAVLAFSTLWFGTENIARIFSLAWVGSRQGLDWLLQPWDVSGVDVSLPEMSVPDVSMALPELPFDPSLLWWLVVGVLTLLAFRLIGKLVGRTAAATGASGSTRVSVWSMPTGWLKPLLWLGLILAGLYLLTQPEVKSWIRNFDIYAIPGATELQSLLGPQWFWIIGAAIALLLLLNSRYGFAVFWLTVIVALYLLFTGKLDSYFDGIAAKLGWEFVQDEPAPDMLRPLEEQSRFYTEETVVLPACTARHSDAKLLRRALEGGTLYLPAMLHYDIVIWSDGTEGWRKYSPVEFFQALRRGEVLDSVHLHLCNERDARKVILPEKKRT